MKPNFLNLFMKKLTRKRVVPTISARVSCGPSAPWQHLLVAIRIDLQQITVQTLSQTEINNGERAWFPKLCNSDQFLDRGTVIFELGLLLTVQQ